MNIQSWVLAAIAISALGAMPEAAQAKPDQSRRPQYKAGSISEDDYPIMARWNREAGVSIASLVINKSGRVQFCTATGATELLNATTCKILQQRFQFEPARNKKGKAVEANWTQRIIWVLPADDIPEALAKVPLATLLIDADGKLQACKALLSTGDPALDAAFCQVAKKEEPWQVERVNGVKPPLSILVVPMK